LEKLKFLGIYLAWGVVAGLVHIFGDMSSATPAVGASGAISGVLGAYLIIFPKTRIQTFLMLGFFWRMMHIQARWFLTILVSFSKLTSVLCWRIWCSWRRCSISCPYWWFCNRYSNWISV